MSHPLHDFLQRESLQGVASLPGFRVVHHPAFPLAVVAAAKSPDPLARACSLVVVHTETRHVLASFVPSFFPFDDRSDAPLDFQGLGMSSLEDGVLVLVFCHEGQWLAAGKDGFFVEEGLPQVGWQIPFVDALRLADASRFQRRLYAWPRDVVYGMELTSSAFGRARGYEESRLFLLTTSRQEELSFTETADLACQMGSVHLPNWFFPTSWPDVRRIADAWLAEVGPYRGFVLKEASGRRFSYYREDYRALQDLLAYGDTDDIPPTVVAAAALTGDAVFFARRAPRHAEAIAAAAAIVREWRLQLREVWEEAKTIHSAKAFSDRMQTVPTAPILFRLRQQVHPSLQSESVLEDYWEKYRSVLTGRLAKEWADRRT